MQKFNFDYYIQRAEVLNEMARPSPWSAMGEAGSRLKQLFDYSGNIIKKGGVINIAGKEIEIPGPAGNRDKVINLLFTLYTLINDDSTLEEELAYLEQQLQLPEDERSPVDLTWKCCDILGIPELQYRQHGYSDSDKLYRAAIKKLIEEKPEYILSDEYKNKVTNPENILRFTAINKSKTPTAKSVATKRVERFGFDTQTTTPEDIDRILSRMGISDIIAQIKKEQAKRKRKFVRQSKKGMDTSDISPEIEETGDQYINNVYTILDALELLSERAVNIKKDINRKFNAMSTQAFNRLDADSVQEILDNFIEEISEKYSNMPPKFIKAFYTRPTSFYDELTSNFNDLLETGITMSDFYDLMGSLKQKHASTPGIGVLIDALLFEVNELKKLMGDLSRMEKDDYNPYDRIDTDILQKYITSPEIGEKVKEYFDLEKRQKQIRADNMKRRVLSSVINQASDQFLMQKEIEKIQKEINKTNSQIRDLSSESYIMNYMTEQVFKDRFKPRGEFKDRGFKKMNYLEWLEKNS